MGLVEGEALGASLGASSVGSIDGCDDDEGSAEAVGPQDGIVEGLALGTSDGLAVATVGPAVVR